MEEELCVAITGPAMAFMLYENAKSSCDQEGLLLGEVIEKVTETIGDDDVNNSKIETYISINYLIAVPSQVALYNTVGEIDRNKLNQLLNDERGGPEKARIRDIVGWYSFRRNAALQPHLRDKVLHKQFFDLLNYRTPEHFVMCLLTTSVSNTTSTHTFNHKFLRYVHRSYEALPLKIIHLGVEQPGYVTLPSVGCLSESFQRIVEAAERSAKLSDEPVMCHIQTLLRQKLRQLIRDLHSSEVDLTNLAKQLSDARNNRNEILLPQLLKVNEHKLANSEPIEVPVSPVCENVCKLENSQEASSQSEHSVTQVGSEDPFAFANELKLEMSQKCTGINTGARVTARGRASRRGSTTRELRTKRGQLKAEINESQELITSPRQTGLSSSDSALTVPPSSPSLASGTSSIKRRSCTTSNKKLADSKVTSKSPVTSANGSSSCSGSQEY